MNKKISFVFFLGLLLVVFTAAAFAGSNVFPPDNRTKCNGSVAGAASGRSILTWDGNNDVSCRDLPLNSQVLKTDPLGNIQKATPADVTPLVNVKCSAGQVLGSINNGTPACIDANSICSTLGGTWNGSSCSFPSASNYKQDSCMWIGVPCGNNGCNGTKQATCPVGYYVAGHGNYREGDWTRTGYNQFYCCK